MPLEPPAVALTGATGFVGAWLLRHLLEAGHPVRALTRRPQAPMAGVQWVEGDLASDAALTELLAGAGTVVHCAGQVRGRHYADFARVNEAGAVRLGVLCGSRDAPPRVLLISSLAARQPELSPYAASKAAGEGALRAACGDRLTVLRPPAIYGPGDEELVPLLRALARGLGVAPAHDGRFALIYVEDLARAVMAWLAQPAADGGCYECHDGRRGGGYRWDELAELIGLSRGRRVRLLRIPRPVLAAAGGLNLALSGLTGTSPMLSPGKVREFFHPDWTVSNDALTAATGWRPTVDLPTGLARTLAAGA